MDAQLLEDVKNYLDITWPDAETDGKLEGILRRGMDYLDRAAGECQDYGKEGAPRSLLFDYCRYGMNHVLEMFEENFRAELVALRMGVQADAYARGQEGV